MKCDLFTTLRNTGQIGKFIFSTTSDLENLSRSRSVNFSYYFICNLCIPPVSICLIPICIKRSWQWENWWQVFQKSVSLPLIADAGYWCILTKRIFLVSNKLFKVQVTMPDYSNIMLFLRSSRTYMSFCYKCTSQRKRIILISNSYVTNLQVDEKVIHKMTTWSHRVQA